MPTPVSVRGRLFYAADAHGRVGRVAVRRRRGPGLGIIQDSARGVASSAAMTANGIGNSTPATVIHSGFGISVA